MNASPEQPTVSVVVPAYNAGKTLKRLLDNLKDQTWKQLQIIVVDDGSTDNTPEVIRQAAEKDPRLTTVRIENRGVSTARNAGLKLCTGRYIRFADADDSLPEHSIETMVRRAEADGSELVITGYEQYIGDNHRYHNLSGRNDTVPCDDLMNHLCMHANSYFYGVLWNKLFLREYIAGYGCRFQEDIYWGEDFAFVMDYLRHVKQVSFIDESTYDYRRSAGSTTVQQALDSVMHPVKNMRIKMVLYGHLKELYRSRGIYDRYRNRLWMYLFRVGLG